VLLPALGSGHIQLRGAPDPGRVRRICSLPRRPLHAGTRTVRASVGGRRGTASLTMPRGRRGRRRLHAPRPHALDSERDALASLDPEREGRQGEGGGGAAARLGSSANRRAGQIRGGGRGRRGSTRSGSGRGETEEREAMRRETDASAMTRGRLLIWSGEPGPRCLVQVQPTTIILAHPLSHPCFFGPGFAPPTSAPPATAQISVPCSHQFYGLDSRYPGFQKPKILVLRVSHL
jgi:hypothetical protein